MRLRNSEGYHWFSAFMGFMGVFCLAYSRVWRIPNLPGWECVFVFAFLGASGVEHFNKALVARRAKRELPPPSSGETDAHNSE